MTDKDIIERVAALMRISYCCKANGSREHWKPVYALRLRGERAVELMRVLRPLMGRRRQEQIDEAVATWAPRQNRVSRDQEADILAALVAGESAAAIGERYGVTKWSIYAIKQGRYFKSQIA
jgi:hypothetical protein